MPHVDGLIRRPPEGGGADVLMSLKADRGDADVRDVYENVDASPGHERALCDPAKCADPGHPNQRRDRLNVWGLLCSERPSWREQRAPGCEECRRVRP